MPNVHPESKPIYLYLNSDLWKSMKLLQESHGTCLKIENNSKKFSTMLTTEVKLQKKVQELLKEFTI